MYANMPGQKTIWRGAVQEFSGLEVFWKIDAADVQLCPFLQTNLLSATCWVLEARKTTQYFGLHYYQSCPSHTCNE